MSERPGRQNLTDLLIVAATLIFIIAIVTLGAMQGLRSVPL